MQRIQLIDALRGIAALGVLAHHFNGRLEVSGFGGWLIGWGGLGVALFFVLSGFVITMTVGDQRISGAFLGRFALRRSLRLDPPYLASIVVLICIGVFGARFGAHQHIPTPGAVLAHLFYLQDLLDVPAISPVYWSLCLEVQFYLFLVLGMWALQGSSQLPSVRVGSLHYQLVILATIVGSLVCRRLGIATGSFIPMWYCFALGVVTYWAYAGWVRKHFALAAIALVAMLGFDDVWALTAAVSAGALLLAAHFGRLALLSDPVSQFFGRLSYSLYLTHSIFGWYALSIAMKFMNAWLATLVGLAVAIGSAWAWYRLIERPSINFSRRMTSSPAGSLVPSKA